MVLFIENHIEAKFFNVEVAIKIMDIIVSVISLK